ncbi:MAG: nitrate reductase [Sulfurimonas sp.]|nr:nitrate reductase [Sulfurimonas sp.]
MFKLILFTSLLSYLLLAKEITSTATFYSVGYVNTFVVDKDKLYVGNNAGTVDIFDIKTQKIINQIMLPPLVTQRNKLVPQKVISVDYLNEKILIVSIGKNSFRNVWIYKNNELKRIVNETKKLTIKKALYINDDRILFGTFGSEVILHDTSENYNIYKSHISQSAMGGIILNEDKTKMITSYESGKVNIIDVATSKILSTYDSQNVDNIYDVAYNNGVLITAGQDRRVAIYKDGEKDFHIKSHFPVYSVGLSPSGKTGAYSSGDEQNIQIFNTKTKALGDILVGHTSRLTQIWFKNEKELYSIGNRYEIYYWKLD